MKSGYALALVLGGSAALSGLVFDPPAKFIWNRTASAPEGLYWLRDEPFTRCDGSFSQPGADQRNGLRRADFCVMTAHS